MQDIILFSALHSCGMNREFKPRLKIDSLQLTLCTLQVLVRRTRKSSRTLREASRDPLPRLCVLAYPSGEASYAGQNHPIIQPAMPFFPVPNSGPNH
ncbi:MAG: hypothetical protein KME23_15470 [Goleter apudmare HA4340-LM2]|jgi:hypothetical protein|nr:hypothetical protein [Goleter apudmare HA4340-LM2]